MELLLEYDDKFELLDYCYYYHHYCNFLCVFLSIHVWGKYTLGMVFGYMMVLKDCPKGIKILRVWNGFLKNQKPQDFKDKMKKFCYWRHGNDLYSFRQKL